MLKLLILTFFLAKSAVASADWASGGGELIQDGQNPWFIQNKSIVHYCTLYDFNHYHQSPEFTEAAIQRAIAFWKNEFKYGQNIFTPRIEVATQQFVKVDCPNGQQDDIDIVFQFGFLDRMQLNFIKDPSRYAGLAIRTQYDRVNLAGKGFIYIAADSGPYRFQGENIVESPWTYNDGGLLYWTLVHELGHVFGLSHTTQSGSEKNVMAMDFIESIMRPFHALVFRNNLNVNSVFDIGSHSQITPQVICLGNQSYSAALKEFFGIDPTWKCYGTKITDSGIEIYASQDRTQNDAHMILIGTARLSSIHRRAQSFTLVTDALHFWLPPEQSVFPKTNHVHTPAYRVEDKVATYRTLDGKVQRQMSFTLDPRQNDPLGDDLKLGGVLNGRLYINFKEGI